MQLSEAIRLGAMMKQQGFGALRSRNETCALGAAYEAAGIFPDYLPSVCIEVAVATFPIMEQMVQCPNCHQIEDELGDVIAHLNDWHRWTREETAEWVASVEATLSTASNRTPDGDAVPVRPTADMTVCSRQDVVLVSKA